MRRTLLLACTALLVAPTLHAQRTVKPVLHGRHWVAITGKPLGATAGAHDFQNGGNAVDAACAMLAAVATMWDTWAGAARPRRSIYDPRTKKVIGIKRSASRRPARRRSSSASKRHASIRPSTVRSPRSRRARPGGLMTMLAEFGTM